MRRTKRCSRLASLLLLERLPALLEWLPSRLRLLRRLKTAIEDDMFALIRELIPKLLFRLGKGIPCTFVHGRALRAHVHLQPSGFVKAWIQHVIKVELLISFACMCFSDLPNSHKLMYKCRPPPSGKVLLGIVEDAGLCPVENDLGIGTHRICRYCSKHKRVADHVTEPVYVGHVSFQ